MAQRVVRQTTSGGAFIQLAVRLGVLAFLVYWSFVLVRPFIPILVWSMVLAVALYPPYNWLSAHLGDRPKLAAAIITVIVSSHYLHLIPFILQTSPASPLLFSANLKFFSTNLHLFIFTNHRLKSFTQIL